MPGPRQPTDLVVAKGRKHLSKAEEVGRRAKEVRISSPKTARPPKWLPEELKKDFRALGKRLIAVGLYTDLDADTLGRYLAAHQQWLKATEEAGKALEAEDVEAAKEWSAIQDRYFKQARGCAGDMGLTVTSRCRLVLPQVRPQASEEINPFLTLIQGGEVKDA